MADAMASFLARLSAEEASGGGGGGGGGATNTASAGNIFEIDSSISGPGGDVIPTFGGLDFNGIMSKDFKSLLEDASPMLNAVFFKMNINAGPLLPTIDYFKNIRNIQPFNFMGIKPVSLFNVSGH